jgi:peptide chain release factor 2
VHRLVRKSPFDSNARGTLVRVGFVSPEVDDDISHRDQSGRTSRWTSTARAAPAASTSTRPNRRCASGILPSGIVVACQSERSQHKNRSTAMKMLKAKLYELEVNKRNAAAKVLEDSKSD